LIETGGMAEIRVFRLFDNAELAIDKFIEVQFPSQNKLLQNGMQTFLPIIKGTQMAWKAIEWEVEPYDLKWFQERRKGKAPESAWYPTGTGAPGTTDDIKGEFFYTCDTVMLSAEQINAKKARVSQGIAIPNSIKMTDFGWINCDRFLRSTDLVEVKIVANDPQVFTYVLFDKRRVATACYTGGSVWIPNNELITIVCMDYSEDGIVTRFAMKKVTAARGQVEMEVESLPNEVMIQHETLLRSLWS
jgi:hypothetical protein